MNPIETQEHMTPEQLAVRYSVHTGTLANWRTRGCGPRYIKIGKQVLYAREDVLRWEEEQKKRSTAE